MKSAKWTALAIAQNTRHAIRNTADLALKSISTSLDKATGWFVENVLSFHRTALSWLARTLRLGQSGTRFLAYFAESPGGATLYREGRIAGWAGVRQAGVPPMTITLGEGGTTFGRIRTFFHELEHTRFIKQYPRVVAASHWRVGGAPVLSVLDWINEVNSYGRTGLRMRQPLAVLAAPLDAFTSVHGNFGSSGGSAVRWALSGIGAAGTAAAGAAAALYHLLF